MSDSVRVQKSLDFWRYHVHNINMTRPKKKQADRRTIPLHIMLTVVERKSISAAAKAAGLPDSSWVRMAILESLRMTRNKNA
jgi:hypothetical protein